MASMDTRLFVPPRALNDPSVPAETVSGRYTGADADVGAHAVDHPIVRSCSLPVDAELAAVWMSSESKRRPESSRSMFENFSVQRHVFGELPVHDRADRRSVVFNHQTARLTVTVSETEPISSEKFCSSLSWTWSSNSLMAISLKPGLWIIK